jgi:hypothetical protein
MEQRRTLTKEIKVQLSPYEAYTKKPFTPELFNACKDFQPGDIIREFKYGEICEVPFGSMDDNEVTSYSPIIVVERKVLETDEEFFTRMKQEEATKKQTDERERLEFLRLKAKFEPES